MTWRRAAEIIAMEAAYRSARKHGKGREFVRITGRSVLRYNILLVLMFSLLSSALGLGAILGREVSYLILSMLFMMDLVMGVLTMALNLQMLVSDRLLDPLRRLPIGDKGIRRTLLWIGIYWGGAALPFLLLPAGLLSSLILGDMTSLIASALMSISALLLSLGLGYLAGSFSVGYTRSGKGLLGSTLAWISLLSLGFAVGPVASWFLSSLEKGASIPEWVVPISFCYLNSTPALASSLAFLLLSASALVWGARRFWKTVSTLEPRIPEGSPPWSITHGLPAALMREVKIAMRTPRVLASLIIYSLVFPVSLISPQMTLLGDFLGEGYSALFMLSVGGLGGFSIVYLYITESSGAKALYLLPITRARVALLKVISFLILNFPLLMAVFAVLWVSSGLPGLINALIYLASFSGSALLNSSVYAIMLPDAPSHWTSETFGRNLIAAIFSAESGFYFMLGLAPLILGLAEGGLVLGTLAAIWLADLILLAMGRRIL